MHKNLRPPTIHLKLSMPDNNSLNFEFERDDMILSIESDFELMAMQEHEYRETMLLASFDDDSKQQRKSHDSHSTALTEDTSFQADGDDQDFLDLDDIPATVHSQSVTNDEDSTVVSKNTGKGTPGKLDVLCGQSRTCASHSGNRRFQRVLDHYAPRYDAVNSKQEKMALTKEIVSCIQGSGGRFLRLKDGHWHEISTVTARDKVSHALRTKAASWKRQQQQEKTGGTSSVTLAKTLKKPTHRGRRLGKNHNRQRSSSSSLNTRSSDIVASSFDGNDPTSNNLIEDLLKTQREIFANLQKNSATSKDEHPLRRTSR